MTAHSKVYLVKYRKSGELRIAKYSDKSLPSATRLRAEADIMKKLECNGIPVIYDILEDNISICIIEEYINGKSLSEYIESMNSCPDEQLIINIMLQLCKILEYLHENNVIHLDIKPSNIMLRYEELEELRVYLIDYDSACQIISGTFTGGQRIVPEEDMLSGKCMFPEECVALYEVEFSKKHFAKKEEATENISCKEIYGTIGYAAPEQFDNIADVRSDIYSAGMVLRYMLNVHISSKRPHWIWSGGRSRELDMIMQRCIRHNSSQRFQSITELREAISRLNKDYRLTSDTEAVNIFVYGTRSGVGVTHFCLCLSSFLAKYEKTICIRLNDTTDYKNTYLCAIHKRYAKSTGCEAGRQCNGNADIMPCCEDAGMYDVTQYRYRIYDCGPYKDTGEINEHAVKHTETDRYVLIGDYGYRWRDISLMNEVDESFVIFINHISGYQYYQYLKNQNRMNENLRNIRRVYRFPCIYEYDRPGEAFNNSVREALNIYTGDNELYQRFRMEICRLKRRTAAYSICGFLRKMLHNKIEYVFKRNSHMQSLKGESNGVLKIGMIGSSRGVGTTHMSIMVAYYYANWCNKRTALVECNNHSDYIKLSGALGELEHFGRFRYRNIEFISNTSINPAYKRQITGITDDDYEVIVYDMDSSDENMMKAGELDAIIIAGGVCGWKLERTCRLAGRLSAENPVIAIRADDKNGLHRYFKDLKKSGVGVIAVPFVENPFNIAYNDLKRIAELAEATWRH